MMDKIMHQYFLKVKNGNVFYRRNRKAMFMNYKSGIKKACIKNINTTFKTRIALHVKNEQKKVSFLNVRGEAEEMTV